MSVVAKLKIIGDCLTWLPKKLIIAVIRVYQMTLSRMLGRTCRFHPSCSCYFIESLNKYGFVRGFAKGIWRICRCHPFHPGGFDPA